MNCSKVRPYLEAYVDCELSPERSLDVEQHLRECEACAAEVELSRSLVSCTRSACSDVHLKRDFLLKLEQDLRHEGDKLHQAEQRSGRLKLSALLPLAAAAAAALAFGWAQTQRHGEAGAELALAGTRPDGFVDLLLKHHSSPPEPEFRDSKSVVNMEPALGLPIRAPNLERYGARFLGANMVHVNSVNAASLHYQLGNRRVTFYVYDPELMPLQATRSLHPRVINDHAVFVGQRRGYSIATCERQGVGYAVAADLSDQESAELVAAVGF